MNKPSYSISKERIDLETAIAWDFIGDPKVHTNPINGLKTVCVMHEDYNDNGFSPNFITYSLAN